MKINLAVYTATEGYSWQKGTRILSNDLKEYKKTIGRFPDPTVDTLPFGGAFVYHDKVVFYRFHIAKKADSKGRDALYLILGECPKNIAMKIDFNSLFAKTEMASPSNPFPFELDYIGAGATACAVDFTKSFNITYSTRADFSSLGYILANCPNEDLLIKITGTQIKPNILISYKATQLSSPVDSNPTAATSTVSNSRKISSTISRGNTHLHTSFEPIAAPQTNLYLLTIIIAIVSLILGVFLGYWIHGIKIKPSGKQISLPGGVNVEIKHKPTPEAEKPESPDTPKEQVPPVIVTPPPSQKVYHCSLCKGTGVEFEYEECEDWRSDCPVCHGYRVIKRKIKCRRCAGTGITGKQNRDKIDNGQRNLPVRDKIDNGQRNQPVRDKIDNGQRNLPASDTNTRIPRQTKEKWRRQ